MYMEWYTGTYDIFFGDRAHAKDGGLQQTQQHSFTDENAGSDDCKHTSGGVSMAIGNGRDSGRHRKKEPSRLFLGHEGRFAQTWLLVR